MDGGEGNSNSGRFQSGMVNAGAVEIKPFKPRTIGSDVPPDYREVKKRFGTLANTDPESNPNFSLNASAKRLLGVEREERSHVEGVVTAEVEARLKVLGDEAYSKGFETGSDVGKAEAYAEHRSRLQPLEERLASLIGEFEGLKKELYSANESFLIGLVFQVAKQVLLRELTTDRDYVKRLALHVVEKIGAKDHVRIRISRQDAAMLDELKDHLKLQIPDLKNLQIEAVDDLPLGGCKVETDLSRMNASVETQLGSIEKALGEA
jgi:flagellar assembly protein FliH